MSCKYTLVKGLVDIPTLFGFGQYEIIFMAFFSRTFFVGIMSGRYKIQYIGSIVGKTGPAGQQCGHEKAKQLPSYRLNGELWTTSKKGIIAVY